MHYFTMKPINIIAALRINQRIGGPRESTTIHSTFVTNSGARSERNSMHAKQLVDDFLASICRRYHHGRSSSEGVSPFLQINTCQVSSKWDPSMLPLMIISIESSVNLMSFFFTNRNGLLSSWSAKKCFLDLYNYSSVL